MIDIEPMKAEHLDALEELEKLCFSVPWSRAMLESELINELAEYFVALEDGEVVGYIGSQTVIDFTNIMNIAVSPAHRRKHIAERLMRLTVSRCREKGVESVSLEVRESNIPAIRLYESFGMKTVGRRRGYYEKPDEDALIMTLDL